jgi:hypothetical protein
MKDDLIKVRVGPEEKRHCKGWPTLLESACRVRIMLRRAAIREYHDAGKRLDFYSSSGSAANAGSNNV